MRSTKMIPSIIQYIPVALFIFSSASGKAKLYSFNSICRKHIVTMGLYLLLFEEEENKPHHEHVHALAPNRGRGK
jgi:hypothetical protein